MPTITLLSSGPVDAPSPLPVDLEDAIAATQGYAQEALDARDLARDWATKTTGEVVSGQGYGAKKYAQDAAEAIAAGQEEVDASVALANDWATKTAGEVVTGQGYGAKKYSQDAAASLSAMLTKLVGAFASAPSYVGDTAPWVVGAVYFNTISNKLKIWTSGHVWVDYDAAAQQAASDATAAAGTASGAATAATGARDTILAFWCGAAAADPTVNGSGGALTASCIYFNTTTGKLRTHASGAWVDYDKAAQDALTATVAARDTALSYSNAATAAYANANALLSSVSASAIIAQQAANNALLPSLSILAAAQRAIKLTTAGNSACPYDVTRDDDSGAWLKKATTQSYLSDTLNTATRGTVAPLPLQSAIIGEPTVLSVFSNVDGAGSLWKSWTVAGLTCVFAKNGSIWYGGTDGLYQIDLITDEVYKRDTSGLYKANQNVATYNQGTATWSLIGSSAQLPSNVVNSIAAFTAPNTPLNPLRCNLPNPTVAVGTSGGVSVIRWDGVVTSSASSLAFSSVTFDDKGNLWLLYSGGSLYACPPATYQTASFNVEALTSFTLAQLLISSPAKITACGPGMVAIAGSTGLARIKLDPTNPSQSLIRVKTTTYDTGWMVLGKTSFALVESSAALSAYAGAATISDISSSASNFTCVGGLSRAQVASGADLAGLTGWGVGNYATGAAIALGTADFEFPVSIVGASITGTQTYLAHGYYTAGAYSGARVLLQSSTTSLTATFHDGTNSASISVASALVAGGNYDVRMIYRSALTRFELWSNGVLIGTAARGSVGSLTNASANLFIGIDPALANPTVSTVILALIRAWTYATTPDQIAFMRADEKGRFVANAKELLSGANVQAVAFDPDTGQLAASNSTGGTDVFAGPGFSVRVANQKSTTGANIRAGSSIQTQTGARATIAKVSATTSTSWAGLGFWSLTEDGTTNTHTSTEAAITLPAGTYTIGRAFKGGSRGFAGFGFLSASLDVNLTTGATANPYNGAGALSSVDLGNGTWLAQFTLTWAGGAVTPNVWAMNALGGYSYAGNNGVGGAAISFGPMMIRSGSTPFTANDYVDGLSANDNHKAVAFAGGDLVVATGAGVDAFLAVKPGLRETAGGVGAPRRPFYDPTWGQFYGFTTDATPTVFASIPIPEGKAYRFRASVVAVMYGGTATEKAVYDITGVVSRDIGGNVVVVSTTTTVSEVTSTMDCVAQANTTAQTLEIKATGKASTRIAWFDGQELYDVGLMAAA